MVGQMSPDRRLLFGSHSSMETAPVKIPRFSGDDPAAWVFQVEQYFTCYNIVSDHKLSLASLYLDGEALNWYCWLSRNKQLADCDHFVEKLLIRFRTRSREAPERRLAFLRQLTTVDYCPARAASIPSWSTMTNSPSSQSWNAHSESNNLNPVCKVFEEMPNKATETFQNDEAVAESIELSGKHINVDFGDSDANEHNADVETLKHKEILQEMQAGTELMAIERAKEEDSEEAQVFDEMPDSYCSMIFIDESDLKDDDSEEDKVLANTSQNDVRRLAIPIVDTTSFMVSFAARAYEMEIRTTIITGIDCALADTLRFCVTYITLTNDSVYRRQVNPEDRYVILGTNCPAHLMTLEAPNNQVLLLISPIDTWATDTRDTGVPIFSYVDKWFDTGQEVNVDSCAALSYAPLSSESDAHILSKTTRKRKSCLLVDMHDWQHVGRDEIGVEGSCNFRNSCASYKLLGMSIAHSFIDWLAGATTPLRCNT